MKKLILLLIFLLFTSCNTVYAELSKNCEDSEINAILNHCDGDANTENGDEAGLGADVVIHESDNPESVYEETTVEYRYDFNSHNQEVFGVVKISLWNAIKGFFNEEE